MRYEDMETCQIAGAVLVMTGMIAIVGLVVLSFVLKWING